MYIIFRNAHGIKQLLYFRNVISIKYNDDYYILRCLDDTVRLIDARQYRILSVEKDGE